MEEKKLLSIAERRWLVREIENGRMGLVEAKKILEPFSKDPVSLIKLWRRKYKPEISFTLPVMSEKEKQKMEGLQKQLKELEKQLEHSQMKNIALETMIDIAEEKLKIDIRKKSGPKL